VWKTFIGTLKIDASEVTEEHLERFAALDLNGRQIKNAVKMAELLALAEGSFKPKHIDAVLEIAMARSRFADPSED
jgi:hypothetical protein